MFSMKFLLLDLVPSIQYPATLKNQLNIHKIFVPNQLTNNTNISFKITSEDIYIYISQEKGFSTNT